MSAKIRVTGENHINPILYLAGLRKLLQLDSISLVQFKNYLQREFRFDSRIVGICGQNGVGKTNLLDAIWYLCFTKSYFSRIDSLNVLNGHEGFRIEGVFESMNQQFGALCIVRENGRKEFSVNGEPYEKFAQHVGRFPCVIIAPDDTAIITGAGELRRRYFDALLSQLDPQYLQSLINYNKILQQRNSFLKSMAEQRIRDFQLLDVYDEQLVTDGQYVFDRRSVLLRQCAELSTRFYHDISRGEDIGIAYDSQLQRTPFDVLLKSLREKDLQLQRTNGGIHKDDLNFYFKGQLFKNIASQGQRKSLLFSLKLAEFEMLRSHKGYPPLLLLDDVFEKLDEVRMHNLLDRVCVQNDGQIFITDTHRSRIEEHFGRLKIDYQLITL